MFFGIFKYHSTALRRLSSKDDLHFFMLMLMDFWIVNERNPSLGLGFAKTQKFGFLPKLFFNLVNERNHFFGFGKTQTQTKKFR